MRITYIAGAALPSRAAHSIQIMKMCQAFAHAGHKVTLVVPTSGGRPAEQTGLFSHYGVERVFSIKQIPIQPIRGGLILWGIKAANECHRGDADLVYGRQLHGCFFAGVFQRRVMLELHAPVKGTLRTILFRLLVKMPNFRGVVTNSYELASIMENDFGVHSEKILAAPNGAEDLGYTPPPHLDGEELSVGYVGHLYQGRGTELILQMATACPWAQFHVIGGVDEDISHWRTRATHLRNLHLHGFVPPSEVERFRRTCDVLLAPYQEEVYSSSFRNQASYMSPLKLFEYMASGRAIICSDLPVLHEILTPGETTIFCEPADASSWIAALERLRKDRGLMIRLGTNARKRFISTFTRIERAKSILAWGGMADAEQTIG